MTRPSFAYLLSAVAAAALMIATPALADDSASQAFQDGQALLRQARFEEALATYERAAQLDAARTEYRDAAAVLRRVVQLRGQLAAEQDRALWERIARSLRGYYAMERIPDASLALDREFHQRFDTAESAELLAETLLEVGQAAEARNLLAARTDLDSRTSALVLLGIANARTGDGAAARKIAQNATLPASAGPEDRLRVARLQALAGDRSQALAMLASAFESTPPSRLEETRARVQACPDFAGLNGTGDFTKALQTASKVPESGCSTGKSCGACPNRTSCSSGASTSTENK